MRTRRLNEKDIRFKQANPDKDGKLVVWVDTHVSALQVHIYASISTYRFVKQINGRRYNKKIGCTTETKLTEARRLAQKLETEIRSSLYHPQSNMLIKEACVLFAIPYYKHFVKDRNPLGIIHNFIIPNFGHFPISKLTAMEAQKFIYNLIEQGYAAETIRKIVLVAKTLYKELVKNQLVIFNPFDNLYRPTVSNIRTITLKQEERLPFIECCIKENSVFGDLILLLLLTGLRVSEAVRIKLDDITDNFSNLNIPTTKASIPQQIALNSYAQELLKRRINLTWNTYVFPSPAKLETHITSPRGALIRIKENMSALSFDISNITLHDLRRTFASTCAEVTGGDLQMVAQQIRHSNIHVLKRYIHRQRNDVIAASEATAQSLMTPVRQTNKKQGSSNA